MAGRGSLGDVARFGATAGDDAVLDVPDRRRAGAGSLPTDRPAQQRGPSLVIWPRATFRSDSRRSGWRSQQRRRRQENRRTSPISATITAARTGPMPGRAWMARTVVTFQQVSQDHVQQRESAPAAAPVSLRQRGDLAGSKAGPAQAIQPAVPQNAEDVGAGDRDAELAPGTACTGPRHWRAVRTSFCR